METGIPLPLSPKLHRAVLLILSFSPYMMECQNAIIAERLNVQLNIGDSSRNNYPLIRQAFRYLNYCGIKVRSSTGKIKGFFFTKNPLEMKKYGNNLRERRNGLSNRINMVDPKKGEFYE